MASVLWLVCVCDQCVCFYGFAMFVCALGCVCVRGENGRRRLCLWPEKWMASVLWSACVCVFALLVLWFGLFYCARRLDGFAVVVRKVDGARASCVYCPVFCCVDCVDGFLFWFCIFRVSLALARVGCVGSVVVRVCCAGLFLVLVC